MMMLRPITWLGVFLAGIVPMNTHAQECFTNQNEDSNTLLLSDPVQLRAFDNCTTIIGDIRIAPDFSGSFVLSSVTNFSGEIYPDSVYHSLSALDTLEMLNLQYIDGIRLSKTTALARVELPLLEEVGILFDVKLDAGERQFDLTALKHAGSLYLSGFGQDASFPSLETVDSSLDLITDMGRDATPMNVDLPVLRELGSLSVSGQIKNLTTPNLAVINEKRTVSPGGLQVNAKYTDFPGVFMPALREIHGELDFKGHLFEIDLSGLKKTDARFVVHADSEVNIYTPVEDVGELYMRGDVTGLNFTDITKATSINILTDTKLPCPKNLIETHRKLYGRYEPPFCDAESIALAGTNTYNIYAVPPSMKSSTPSPSSTPTPSYRPSPTPGPGSGLNESGKTLVITITVVVGLFAVGGLMVFRRKRKHARKAVDASNTTPASAPVGLGRVGRSASRAGGVGYNGNSSGSGNGDWNANSHVDVDATTGVPRFSADEAPPPYSKLPPRG